MVLTGNFAAAKANGAHPARVTNAYPEPYPLMEAMPKKRLEAREVGDPKKAVARMFELVSGTGYFKERNYDFVRVMLGPDCGTRVQGKLKLVAENVDETEELWRSTNMDDETLDKYARGEH